LIQVKNSRETWLNLGVFQAEGLGFVGWRDRRVTRAASASSTTASSSKNAAIAPIIDAPC
jgi:hypothetical protein